METSRTGAACASIEEESDETERQKQRKEVVVCVCPCVWSLSMGVFVCVEQQCGRLLLSSFNVPPNRPNL